MSRRSLFGSHYSHQPNISKYKYSYPSDVSLSSHYGYTSWGLWRDTGHLSPSVYSKKRINIRSFSILIMSAAFIVLLAVLSVAGLAFYFSTFKSDPTECKYDSDWLHMRNIEKWIFILPDHFYFLLIHLLYHICIKELEQMDSIWPMSLPKKERSRIEEKEERNWNNYSFHLVFIVPHSNAYVLCI